MKDLTNKNKQFRIFESIFVDSVTWFTIILVILFFLGVTTKTTHALLSVLFVAKAFLGLYLMYRFYPMNDTREYITELDRKVAFACGLFIVALAGVDFAMPYVNQLRDFVSHYSGGTVQTIEKNFFG